MFNQDSTFMTILNKAADMVILSVLWCVCSLPLLTIGASSSALYHTAVKVIRQGRGYAFSAFLTSFRQNLKQTIPLTLLLAAFYAALGPAYIFSGRRRKACSPTFISSFPFCASSFC